MKLHALAFALSTPVFAAAAAPAPEFGDAKILMPALSLAKAAKEALPNVFAKNPASPLPRLAAKPRLVPKLRIIVPKTNADLRMSFAPDESIDYKLRISEGPGSGRRQ